MTVTDEMLQAAVKAYVASGKRGQTDMLADLRRRVIRLEGEKNDA